MSIDDIIGALREEMLAQNYMNSNRYAFMTVTPEQRWKDWLRVNDRVIVEAAAFPAEDFMVDVKEPTDAELQAFFEKKDADGVAYKDREASPVLVAGTELPSEIPGFKIPRKIDLDYIEANYDSFLAKAEEKVTEEEIAKYYEDHKDPMFIKADTGLMEDPGTSSAPPATERTGQHRSTSDRSTDNGRTSNGSRAARRRRTERRRRGRKAIAHRPTWQRRVPFSGLPRKRSYR